MRERAARIHNISRRTAEAYLPRNYDVSHVDGNDVIITGHDHAGWTLEDYVIPRLASGLHVCEEIDDA